MDLPEFKSKIKEVCKKAVMFYDFIPFSYDPEEKKQSILMKKDISIY